MNSLGFSTNNTFYGDVEIINGSLEVDKTIKANVEDDNNTTIIGDPQVPPSFNNVEITGYCQSEIFKNVDNSFATDGQGNLNCNNLFVTGNSVINGVSTEIKSSELKIVDPIIEISKDNPLNHNTGLVSGHDTTKYRGMLYDTTQNKFLFFNNDNVLPTTNNAYTPSEYANIRCNNVYSSSTDLNQLKTDFDNLNIFNIVIDDNKTEAFTINEGINKYLDCDTTDNKEKITLHKPTNVISDFTVSDKKFNGVDIEELKSEHDTHLASISVISDPTKPNFISNDDQGGTYRRSAIDKTRQFLFTTNGTGVIKYVYDNGNLTFSNINVLTGTTAYVTHWDAQNILLASSGGHFYALDTSTSLSVLFDEDTYGTYEGCVIDSSNNIWIASGLNGIIRYTWSGSVLVFQNAYDPGSPVHDLVYYGNRLIACSNNGFYIVDISNPSSPVMVGSENTMTSGSSSLCAVVDVVNNQLYIGRNNGLLSLYNITNETSPQLLNELDIGPTVEQIQLYKDGNAIYLYIANSTTGLRVFQNQSNILVSVETIKIGSGHNGVVLHEEKNLIFCGEGGDGLRSYSFLPIVGFTKIEVSESLKLGSNSTLVESDADRLKNMDQNVSTLSDVVFKTITYQGVNGINKLNVPSGLTSAFTISDGVNNYININTAANELEIKRPTFVDAQLVSSADIISTLGSVWAKNSFILNSVAVNSTNWNYLVNMDQHVSTTSSPNFVDVKINNVASNLANGLCKLDNNGGLTIPSNLYNGYNVSAIGNINQDVRTNASPTFSNISISAFGTVDGVDLNVFKNMYDTHIIDYNSKINQSVLTTSNVQFPQITTTLLDFNNVNNNYVNMASNSKTTFVDAGLQEYIVFDTTFPKNTEIKTDVNFTNNMTITGTINSVNITTLNNTVTSLNNTVTTHVNDATKHRIINDSGTSLTELWSAGKIDDAITSATSTLAPHIANSSIHTVLNDTITTTNNVWSGTKIENEISANAGTVITNGVDQLTTLEVDQLKNIGFAAISPTEWSHVSSMQSISTNSQPIFNGVISNSKIVSPEYTHGFNSTTFINHDTNPTGTYQRVKITTKLSSSSIRTGLKLYNEAHTITSGLNGLCEFDIGHSSSARNSYNMSYNHFGNGSTSNSLTISLNGVGDVWANLQGNTVQPGTCTASAFLNFTGLHVSKNNTQNIEEGVILISTNSTTIKKKQITTTNGPVDSKEDDLANNDIYTAVSDMKDDPRVIGIAFYVDGKLNIVSVGEGAMMVCTEVINNGVVQKPINNGDYICSSDVNGYGWQQSDDLKHNYTIAKTMIDEPFTSGYNEFALNNKIYRKKLIPVNFCI